MERREPLATDSVTHDAANGLGMILSDLAYELEEIHAEMDLKGS